MRNLIQNNIESNPFHPVSLLFITTRKLQTSFNLNNHKLFIGSKCFSTYSSLYTPNLKGKGKAVD